MPHRLSVSPTQSRSSRPSLHALTFGLTVFLVSVNAMASSPAPTTHAVSEASPSELTVQHHPALPEALISFGVSTPTERSQLQVALAAYERTGQPERVEPLVNFLAKYPDSQWRQSLWLNLGDIYYRHGFFSDALHAWRESWESARSATGPMHRAIADQAVGELIRMHARLGHADEVDALLREIGSRALTGAATEAVQGAREGLWKMRNEPGVAYLCGPMALKSLVAIEPSQSGALSLLEGARSGPNGFSLQQVASLSQQARLPYRAVFRERGEDIPVPSVVHWKVNHYAAIVGETNGRYQIKDPTFGSDLWLTAAAINAQTSGYFLVSADRSAPNWRRVGEHEAQGIRGMGYTSSLDDKSTRPYDDKECCDTTAGKGMPSYSIHSMLASLSVQDTPVGYVPPRGPTVNFTVSYSQREAYQPAIFPFSNLGQKWTHNWLSYVTDDPTQAGASVSVAVPGGGTEAYAGYDSGTGAFRVEARLGAVLVRTASTPITYERRFSDGSVHVYQKSDGSTYFPRRIFLKSVRDSAGNAITLDYDFQLRLVSLTDALAKVTTLSYNDPADAKHITRVTDPFGRYASFGYDASGRLSQIIDVIGMSSTIAYDAGTFINGLTTPYGTTTFAYSGSGMTRWLQITDPLGKIARLETLHAAPGIPGSEAVVPSGLLTVNAYLEARNTFYWDKDTWALAPGDYTKATLKHWLHAGSGTVTAPTLESTKRPGESRVWFNYQGQTQGHFAGPTDWTTATARVLDDGSTQITRAEYNTLGRRTKAVDAVGREEIYEYDVNNIDLLRVKRKNGASYELVAQLTYNAQHLPLTKVDAAGKTTTLTYNAAGQPLTITNPLLQKTTHEYSAAGYLLRTKNASNIIQQSFTYDAYGRIRTTTDSEGYVLTYDYDALDRLTRITFPDTTYESYTYDKLDRSQVRDRLGRVTTYTFNAVRQLLQVDEPLPRTVRTEWSPAGRRTALFDGESRPIRWEYDIAGRLTAEVYADATRKTLTYDLAGRLKSSTDALNQTKNISYTPDDRVAGLSYSNAINATPSVVFAYDPVHPRLVSMTDGIGTTSFAYGAISSQGAEQIIREDGPYASKDVLAYSYDALGRRASRTIGATYSSGVLSGGQLESYAYDILGRLKTKTNALGTFTFSYLGQTGQLTRRSVSTTGGLNPGLELSYDTNANDRRLTQMRYTKSTGASALQDYNYSSDVLGRLTLVDEVAYDPLGGAGNISGRKTWDIVNDGADRLQTKAPGVGSDPAEWYEYSYDRADNRGASSLNGTIQTATHNALNQIDTLNGQAVSHLANGNLTSLNPTTQYNWDAEGRLVQAQVGTGTFIMRYDGFGRLIESEKVGSSGPVMKLRHAWCDAKICESRTRAGAESSGTEFDEGLRKGTISYLYFRDQLGTVRQVRSRSSSSDVGFHEYGPYGEDVSHSGQASLSRYADMFYLTGNLGSPGVYFTWYRAYNANVGRWLTRDPIGVEGGINPYAYVNGNPLGFSDPFGDNPIAIGAGIGTAIAPGPGTVVGGVIGGIVLGGIIIYAQCKDDEDDRKAKCDEQALKDEQMCRMSTVPGTGPRARCWASVQERYGACKTGKPIPRLVIW